MGRHIFIYCYNTSDIVKNKVKGNTLLPVYGLLYLISSKGTFRYIILWKEGNVLFNITLNTFYLQLYGIRHMVKDHSNSERENPLLSHGLLFPISSKGSFIYIILQTG